MDFIFDGKSLSSFGYMCFDNGIREEELAVSEMTYQTIKSALSDISLKVSHSYENNYTTTIMIMKDCCASTCRPDNKPHYEVDDGLLTVSFGECDENGTATFDDIYDCEDAMYMTDLEISTMTQWLVRKEYKWFNFTDRYVWFKVQNKINKIYYGEDVIGLAITVNSNAPFGFSAPIEEEVNSKSFSITAFTDEEGYIYPDVELTFTEGGLLQITNAFDGSVTKVKNIEPNEKITFLGETQQIISDRYDHDLSVDFNYVYPRLCFRYGDNVNEFTSNLACTGTVTYRGLRKVGM